MIAFQPIDIFAESSDAIIIPVNCVGVMGAGVAKVAARAFGPELVSSYRFACSDSLEPGRIWAWRSSAGQWVLCAPTKRHWRNPSRIEDVQATAEAIHGRVAELGCRVVSCPALGCGLGGLPWPRVQVILQRLWGDLAEHYIVSPPR